MDENDLEENKEFNQNKKKNNKNIGRWADKKDV